ncbi:cadherin repeat domain-containing protein [Bradyrhizobium septentrionale]|uniref:Cadherin domain-containing protein n=1 Tax=Bradyrhizobium septentrionale TaxID=1404411 RepID=A0A973W8R6_9BRAD|nr:cadherin repeat domain-containing protein [Bradyrhizobium septentrionale]UGY18283.1 cadherin domain-containing protein [Bradyrhizobium septentrionale]UGY26981.1 cadherin domain-containing protein [Bradyrhizobium septentrionale]
MTTIPAYTIGGLTRPELHLDPSGNIILDPAAQAFVDAYGLQYLYLGCPPGTPFPPIHGFLSAPTDTNSGANTVVEGAAVNSSVNITAHSDSLIGLPVTYSLTSDSSHGGFKIDANTGVVTIADPTKVDFESSGGSYVVNVQATDGIFVSSQSFTIAVSNAPPSTPTDSNATANAVNEGAAVNTLVGITAAAADVNGPGVTYSLTADTSNGGFKIDPNTGVVSVANSGKIDFETAPGHAYSITVQASDGHGGVSLQTFTINVNDLPVSTPVDVNAAANAVVEGAAANTLVGVTASAVDPNGPATTYSLTGDTSGGGFKIDASTGVVTVADPTKLDFESSAPGHAYTITVHATAGATSSTQTFTINVTDAPPSAPTDTDATANSVTEGAAAGTVVGVTAHATDINGGAVTYSLVGDTSGGGFTVNAATGVVTVADPTKLDFETSHGSYTITAQASDGTLSSTQTFTVNVTDVAPSTPVDSNAAANAVVEGAAVGSTVGITASSTDVNGPGVTYSLTGDTSGGGFTIDSHTGVITVADPTKIDYESAPGHAYTVTAQASDGTLTNSQTFTIGVNEAPPSSPVDSDAAANAVAEGAAAGTAVGVTASSTDVNGPPVTYALIGDTSGGGFTINATTGVITVADPTKIDYESSGAGHSYTVTAQASDGTTASSQTFTIGVTDVAPSAPVDSDVGANSVVEGAANGSTVGIIASAIDINGPAVTYSLTGDTSGGGFTINAATGVITVADSSKIDYETAAGHAYTVTATASDGTLTNSQTFTIAVNDVAPSAPVDGDAAGNNVVEGAAAGTAVGVTASSTDVNGPAVTYSLTGDTSGGGFTINATTGVITVADPTKLDYESAPGHAYTVTAQASDGTLTNLQTFTIAVNDAPPSAPVDADAGANSITEGAANGSTVGITASSTDVNGPAVTYSLIGDTSGGGFTINATTGVITVADSTKIDFESSGGSYTVVAQSSDGTLANSQTFTIAVTDVAPSTPIDSDAGVNRVAIGAPAGSGTGVTASSTDVNGPAVTYSLVGDTSGGAFTINAATGKVTVADPTKINIADPSYDVTVDASDGTLHNQQTFTIAVVVDQAPVVTAGHTLNYTENQAATAIDSAITVTDGDDANLVSATVQITGGYVNGEDVLAFANTATITGTFNAATGTLTLTGTDTVANYQAALAAVTYHNTSDNPSGAARTVTITANDGTLDSSPVTDTINVTPVNDPPVVVAGHTLNYTENQAATAFDPAITVSDVDNTTLASATVQITGNYANGQDVLAFTTQNGITGSFNAGTGLLTLTGTATVAQYQAALASVTYQNTSDNPSGLARTVTIITNDGSANSAAVTDTINVTPVNDPPVTTAGGTLNYTENQAASVIDASVNVSDVDSANMSSATVAITGGFAAGQDVLGFVNQNGISGSYNSATGVLTLTGSSSVANYKAALDSITYFNSSDNPSGADRTVSFTVNDGSANSNTSTSTIHVTPVNDAPVVSFGAITGFSEPPNGTPASSSTPVTITPNLTISDAEGNNITDATFVLNNLKASDALSIAGHAGTSGDIGGIHFDITSTAGTETISFTGTDTLAHYNAVLDLIQFNNTSENPDSTARSYTLTVHDDGGTANGGNNTGTASTTGSVTAVDDAPTAAVPADNSLGTAFSHTDFAISGLSVADIDSDPGTVTATVSSAHANLTFNTAGLASFTNNDSHTVTLTGTAAQVNTALATLTYNSDDGFAGSDTVTLNVSDNGHTGTGGPLTSGAQTFHVGVVPQVFYIDNSATALANSHNLGTAADPYTSIAAFNAANPAGSGDYVVLRSGTYTEANGINLANGVNLVGGSHALTFTNPVTGALVTANAATGTDPVIKVTGADNGIDLLGASGHSISGVSIDTSASTGIGISDDGNNVGTVSMSDITVKTASGAGLSFTHGGTITVTGSNNTISSTTGTALDVEHTNIGAGNLTFKSISATGSSGSAGIILDTTGSAGGLTVTGTGTAGSGGTINNKTGADILSGTDAGGQTTSGTGGTGIYLHNTSNVSLSDMSLHDFSNFAIYGNNVTGFTFADGTISGTNGTNNAGDREESSIRFDNLLGTSSITGSSISGGFDENIDLYNTSGTLNRLTMDSDTFGLIGSTGNDNVRGQVYNSATANYTLTNSTFAGTRADFIAFTANNNSSMDAVVRGNTFHNGQAIVPGGGTAVDIRSGSGGLVSAATTTFDISHNILTDGGANAFDTVGIFVAKGQDNGTMSGTIASNSIGPAKVGSNSDGIFVRDAGAGTLTTLIQNNTITGVGNNGIHLQNNDGSSTLNATIYGNSVSSPTSANPFAALLVDNGATATDTSTTNVVIGSGTGGAGTKNTLNHNATYATDVELSNFNGNTHLNLSKNGSTSGTAAGVITDDNTSGTGAITVDTSGGSGTTTLVGTLPTLPTPVAPLLATAGGVQATTPTTGEMHLTQSQLDSVVSAAIDLWAKAGAGAGQLAALHAVSFSVADLAGQIVGQEGAGHITIDTDAAGHGWFVDPTPSDNSEFTNTLNASGSNLQTDPSTAAAGHLDLLTTVVHELGHVLGLPDTISASDVNDLMYIGLADGERRLPTTADLPKDHSMDPGQPQQNFVFASSAAPSSQQPASAPSAGVAMGHSFDFSAFAQTPQADTSHTMAVAANAPTWSDLFSGQSNAGNPWAGHETTFAAMGGTPTDNHLHTQHDLLV